jgi:hypothetical protein
VRVLDDKVRRLGDKISAPDDLLIGFHSRDYNMVINEPSSVIGKLARCDADH